MKILPTVLITPPDLEITKAVVYKKRKKAIGDGGMIESEESVAAVPRAINNIPR